MREQVGKKQNNLQIIPSQEGIESLWKSTEQLNLSHLPRYHNDPGWS